MGHGNATVGDRYRHILRGQLLQDSQRLDDYLHQRTGEVITLRADVSSTYGMAQIA
jgi:hypothetical protein